MLLHRRVLLETEVTSVVVRQEGAAQRHPVSPGLLAVVQSAPVLGEVDTNMAASARALSELPFAANRLVVFPELVSTGYTFTDRAQAWNLAEPVPTGPTTRRWEELAACHSVYIVAGLLERDGPYLFNTAILVGPEGFVAKYRKLHLWSEEKLIYEPGNLGMVVCTLPFARVGLMICYDMWFPEHARILRQLGADVLAIPSAWVWNDTPGHVKRGYYMADYVAMVTAHLNQVFIAVADRVGRDNGQWFFGSSVLVSPVGWPLQGPAGDQCPIMLSAEVDFVEGRRLRGWGALDHFDVDRRTDLYDNLLGYRPAKS